MRDDSGSRAVDRKPGSDSALTTEECKSLVLLGLFVMTILMSVGLNYAVQEENRIPRPLGLRIDYVFTQLMATNELTYELDLRLLITNTALAPAREVRIEIAGIDNQAKLTYDKAHTSDFDIPARNTTERSVKLIVPKVTAHKMFVMVFMENELMLKGYSIISVTGDVQRQDFSVTYHRENIHVQGGPAERSSRFEALFFFFFLLVVIELLSVLTALRSRHLSSALVKTTVRRWRHQGGES